MPFSLSVKTAPDGKLADDQVKSSPSTSVAVILKVISTPSVPSWSLNEAITGASFTAVTVTLN